ncbi:mucin-5AC-like isoform X2 [Lineus longissimus]|uniref:mucin-5AC-like isoform X2 n=1 Tax=Lineus longissimus TaxID=88925 RepID=UPI00315D4693
MTNYSEPLISLSVLILVVLHNAQGQFFVTFYTGSIAMQPGSQLTIKITYYVGDDIKKNYDHGFAPIDTNNKFNINGVNQFIVYANRGTKFFHTIDINFTPQNINGQWLLIKVKVEYGSTSHEFPCDCTFSSTSTSRQLRQTLQGAWTTTDDHLPCKRKNPLCSCPIGDIIINVSPPITGCSGRQDKVRYCTNPAPQNGGLLCLTDKGVRAEVLITAKDKDCDIHCTIDGAWGNWGAWSACDVTCGNGVRLRKRLCDNPKPHGGGEFCPGRNSEPQQCSVVPCNDGTGTQTSGNSGTTTQTSGGTGTTTQTSGNSGTTTQTSGGTGTSTTQTSGGTGTTTQTSGNSGTTTQTSGGTGTSTTQTSGGTGTTTQTSGNSGTTTQTSGGTGTTTQTSGNSGTTTQTSGGTGTTTQTSGGTGTTTQTSGNSGTTTQTSGGTGTTTQTSGGTGTSTQTSGNSGTTTQTSGGTGTTTQTSGGTGTTTQTSGSSGTTSKTTGTINPTATTGTSTQTSSTSGQTSTQTGGGGTTSETSKTHTSTSSTSTLQSSGWTGSTRPSTGTTSTDGGSSSSQTGSISPTASTTAPTALVCSNANDYYCQTGSVCVPRNQLCDSKLDCPNGNDEKGCSGSGKEEDMFHNIVLPILVTLIVLVVICIIIVVVACLLRRRNLMRAQVKPAPDKLAKPPSQTPSSRSSLSPGPTMNGGPRTPLIPPMSTESALTPKTPRKDYAPYIIQLPNGEVYHPT